MQLIARTCFIFICTFFMSCGYEDKRIPWTPLSDQVPMAKIRLNYGGQSITFCKGNNTYLTGRYGEYKSGILAIPAGEKITLADYFVRHISQPHATGSVSCRVSVTFTPEAGQEYYLDYYLSDVPQSTQEYCHFELYRLDKNSPIGVRFEPSIQPKPDSCYAPF